MTDNVQSDAARTAKREREGSELDGKSGDFTTPSERPRPPQPLPRQKSDSPKSLVQPLSFPSTVAGSPKQISPTLVRPLAALPLSTKKMSPTGIVSPAAVTKSPTQLLLSSGQSSVQSSFAQRISSKIADALRITDGTNAPLAIEEVSTVAKAIAVAVEALGNAAGETLRMRLIPALNDPKNTVLRKKLRSGAISPTSFVKFTEDELRNPEAQAEVDAVREKQNMDRNMVELKKSASNPTKMFICKRCKGRNMDFDQRQTRGGDEPMTVTLTCMDCDFVERGCDITNEGVDGML